MEDAIGSGDLAKVKECYHAVMYEDWLKNPQSSWKSTPLLFAVNCGHVDIVKWLIQECKVSVDEHDSNHQTALMCSTSLEMLLYLLSAGAQVHNNARGTGYYHRYLFDCHGEVCTGATCESPMITSALLRAGAHIGAFDCHGCQGGHNATKATLILQETAACRKACVATLVQFLCVRKFRFHVLPMDIFKYIAKMVWETRSETETWHRVVQHDERRRRRRKVHSSDR